MARAPAPAPVPPEPPKIVLPGILSKYQLGTYEKPKPGAKSADQKRDDIRKGLKKSLSDQLTIFETGQPIETGDKTNGGKPIVIKHHWEGTDPIFFPIKYGNRILKIDGIDFVIPTKRDEFPALIADLLIAVDEGTFDEAVIRAYARPKK